LIIGFGGSAFKRKMNRAIGGYEFEVGVLDDKPHKDPKDAPLGQPQETGTYAGGPVRKVGRTVSAMTTGEILVANMERLNVNLLLEPFRNPSDELNRFTTAFLQMALNKKLAIKRVENLLQAVVRNPILREDYGENNPTTADNKGFNRNLFDTGQMFKAIKAKAKRV